MHYTFSNLIKKFNINRDLALLLIIGGLYSFGIFLSNTFVNVYLWKHSGDYITIAVYNLGIFIFQSVTFVLAGKMAKKMDRIIVLRLGVTFLSIFFLSVLLVGHHIATYNFILGSVLGIGYGFYWLAYNVMTFEITEPETRDFFNGVFGILESLGGMIAPLLAGMIISYMTPAHKGYMTIFALSFGLFILAVICTFFLQRRQAEGNFYLKKVFMERRENNNWRLTLNAHIFQGLREGMFLFVITIWVFLITEDELYIGIFNLLLSGLSLVFYFVATRLIKAPMRKQAILFASILLYGSVFIIVFDTSYLKLIMYALVVGAAMPIINVPYVSMTYDVIGQAKEAKSWRIEYIVVREIFVNIGRIASIIFFVISLSIFPSEQAIPILLMIFGAGYLFVFYFMKHASQFKQ